MAVKLIIESETGTLDLSSYLNPNSGAGLDPADPQFTNKVFAHSLLKQGGTLALEDLKLRELVFPLSLKAASKDVLTALVREVNTIINGAACEVEWQDEGATTATTFDLASGQCDPEFDFRQGQQKQPWLKAKLRLFVQPLASRGAPVVRAPITGGTSAATAPVVQFTATGSVGGDAPALLMASIWGGAGSGGEYMAISVLPDLAYQSWWQGASMGPAFAASSNFSFSVATANGSFRKIGSMAVGAFTGQNRLLLMARPLNNASSCYVSVQAKGVTFGESPFFAASAVVGGSNPSGKPWDMIDMGVLTVPGSPAAQAWYLEIEGSSPVPLQVYGAILLPENTTCWLHSASPSVFGNVSYVFDGVYSQVRQTGFLPWTQAVRGPVPVVLPGATAAFAALWYRSNGEPLLTNVSVALQERTRYVF